MRQNPRIEFNLHTTLALLDWPAHRSANDQEIISNPMSANASVWFSVASVNGVTFLFQILTAECHHRCLLSSSAEIVSVPHYLINHQK